MLRTKPVALSYWCHSTGVQTYIPIKHHLILTIETRNIACFSDLSLPFRGKIPFNLPHHPLVFLLTLSLSHMHLLQNAAKISILCVFLNYWFVNCLANLLKSTTVLFWNGGLPNQSWIYSSLPKTTIPNFASLVLISTMPFVALILCCFPRKSFPKILPSHALLLSKQTQEMIISSLAVISHLLTAPILVSHCTVWNRKAIKNSNSKSTHIWPL